jgi:signal transduction histidine kinase
VAELLERMQLRLQDRASQAEMQWACEVPKEVADIRVRTDAVAVEQIVFNLVDNACKYACSSEDKRIHLTADCTGADKISISIRDHGPGISFSGAKRLFRPFSKSADEAATSAPGVGLGLALSRRLAKELGGVLELTRLEGYGAVFVLTIPVASE